MAAALALAVLLGCKKEQPAPPARDTTAAVPAAPAPAALGTITTGKAIGADKNVTAPSDTFGVRDTIYASIATTGSGDNVKLKAVWTFGSSTVRADSQMVNLSGPAVSEFHISRPKAWPKGAYKVTITLNDGQSQQHDFVVK